MIAPLPFAWECKPGSATLPFFGVQPVLLTDKGEEIQGPGEQLCQWLGSCGVLKFIWRFSCCPS